MKLYSWNVNGIRAVLRKGELQSFMQQYDPDILCLQEIKAAPEQITADFPGYHAHYHSARKPGYAGTAILSKQQPLRYRDGLPEELIEKFQLASDAYGAPAEEGRVIAAEFADVWVVTVYTPNSKGDLSRLALRQQQWDPAFLAYVCGLQQGLYGAAKPVLFCGDLNVAHTEDDLARPKENVKKHGFTKEERAGFDAMVAAGFHDTFRLFTSGNGHYSWWSHWGKARERNVGWRIDYWLASSQLVPRITAAAILPQQMGSDHCPVMVELATSVTPS